MQPEEERLLRLGIPVGIEQPLQTSVGVFANCRRILTPVSVPVARSVQNVTGQAKPDVDFVRGIEIGVQQPVVAVAYDSEHIRCQQVPTFEVFHHQWAAAQVASRTGPPTSAPLSRRKNRTKSTSTWHEPHP